MSDSYAVALASMHQDMVRLDRVASNLANVSTPGYKREVVAVQPFVDVMEGIAADAAARSAEMTSGVVAETAAESGLVQVRNDMRAGTLKSTGQPLDVALESEGFFEVATPNGTAYTRQGDFRLDAQGRLVTAQGYPVMGKGGEIRLSTSTPHIDSLGAITEPDATFVGPSSSAPGVSVAQLKIVKFEHPEQLPRLGEGLMGEGPGLTIVGDDNVRIRQGALENANVSSMQEMVQLMQTMRHFESMQKIAQGYDEMLGTALQKLGEVS
ncbi:flagellar hook-basal body protein [Trinickia fusca]|uniref:Flagellar hook-basal body protein n=1 Tax=Trinickia fusca TaxID=2419777 RepID=A0A494XCR0_9BURK|nr:flagellar hook-basal body protein [Trinickia fusca]RKP48410.1 flagellar hook-basal body protein [Trinickia fusca]